MLLFSISLFSNEIAVVNTDVLLIKKYASENSRKLSFYKMNDLIEVIDTEVGIENKDVMWHKTKKGYVKSKYVILQSNLPQFLDKNDVEFDKYVIQLIVYNPNVSRGLIKLQKTLQNENNIYIQRNKKSTVAYLVNFKNYSAALKKQKEIKKYYKTSFISKIKNNLKKDINFEKIPIKEVVTKQDNDADEEVLKEKVIIVKPKKEQTNKKINNAKKTIKLYVEKPKKISPKSLNYYDDDEFSSLDKNIEDEIGNFDIDKRMKEFEEESFKPNYKTIKKYVPKKKKSHKIKESTITSKVEKKVIENKVTHVNKNDKVIKEEKNFNNLIENILIGL